MHMLAREVELSIQFYVPACRWDTAAQTSGLRGMMAAVSSKKLQSSMKKNPVTHPHRRLIPLIPNARANLSEL